VFHNVPNSFGLGYKRGTPSNICEAMWATHEAACEAIALSFIEHGSRPWGRACAVVAKDAAKLLRVLLNQADSVVIPPMPGWSLPGKRVCSDLDFDSGCAIYVFANGACPM